MINFEFLQEARKKADPKAWGYLIGGAEDEITLRRNRAAFQDWSFLPTALTDISHIDTETRFLGLSLPYPIVAAPVGGLTQFHPEGEVEWAHGVKEARTLGALSGVSRIEASRVIQESGAMLYFQLYFFGDDQWVKTQVTDAEKSGYRGIVITTDTAYYGQRERDILAKYDSRNAGRRTAPPPPDRDRNTKLTWNEVKKIVSYTKLPVFLKGVFLPEDVKKAKLVGIKGLWISNHGGRQLDLLPSTLSLLRTLAPACRKAAMPIIFDGGVRRGGEAAMALHMGADLVALGRLPIYGLISKGREGVKLVFDQFISELKLTMGLLGVNSVQQLKSSKPVRLIPHTGQRFETKWDREELTYP